jgi:DNA-binding HxlR family transcriptional regulator
MVERKVIQDTPIVVEYRLTTHGMSIKDLIYHIVEWGLKHRKIVFKKD